VIKELKSVFDGYLGINYLSLGYIPASQLREGWSDCSGFIPHGLRDKLR
jgi:hypothetical protein